MHYPSTPLWNNIAHSDRKRDAVYLACGACYILDYIGLVDSPGGKDPYIQKLITCSHVLFIMNTTDHQSATTC